MCEISDVIREYVSTELLYDRPGAPPEDDLSLVEQGALDSIKILRMISFLERRFNFAVPPQAVRLENFETIAAIARLVQAHTGRDAKGEGA